MKKNLALSLWWLLFLHVTFCHIDCPTYSTPVYDQSTKSTRCERCPVYCSLCHWNEETKATECSACKDQAFRNEDGTCGYCVKGCDECTGPLVKDCSTISGGFYYDSRSNELKQCKEGCTSCDHHGNCFGCASTYRKINKLDSTGNLISIEDTIAVDCVKCKSEFCNECEVDQFGTEVCISCISEYGVNVQTNRCAPCPVGCLACHGNSQICNFCKEGYQKALFSPDCKEINIKNCGSEEIESKKCIWCQPGFIQNPKDAGETCVSCDQADPFCSSCREKTKRERTLAKDDVDIVCTSCPPRFSFNEETKKCEKCLPHCGQCTTPKECFTCDPGYQLDRHYNCKKVEVPNCDKPHGRKGCATCRAHYYLDSKDKSQCKKCHVSCLTCDGPEEDDCTSCSVDRYAFKSESDSPFADFFFFSKTKKCVHKCPKDHKGKSYTEHDLTRECVEMKDQEIKALTKYTFQIAEDPKTWESIYLSTVGFLQDFKKYVKQSKETAHQWAKKHRHKTSKYSDTCNYRGFLVERVSAIRETYYHCECNVNDHGANCEVDNDLFKAVQTFALKTAKDVIGLQGPMKENLFGKIFINLCQAPLAINTLLKLVMATRTVVSLRMKTEIKDIPMILSVLDSFLKSFYTEKNELEHRANGNERDIDYQKLQENVYSQLQEILNMGDGILHTNIPVKTTIGDLSTDAFQLTDFKANNHTFKMMGIIYVKTPNLLGLTELMVPIRVSIQSEFLDKNFENYRVVLWSYSRHLFPPELNYASHLVYLFYLKISGSYTDIVDPQVKDDDSLVIRFPLRVMPPEVDLKKVIKCVAIEFEGKNLSPKYSTGGILNIGNYQENDRPFVVCKFKELQGKYYSVIYHGEDAHTIHLAKDFKAMDKSDGFQLKIGLDMKAKGSSRLSFMRYLMLGVLLLLWSL